MSCLEDVEFHSHLGPPAPRITPKCGRPPPPPAIIPKRHANQLACACVCTCDVSHRSFQPPSSPQVTLSSCQCHPRLVGGGGDWDFSQQLVWVSGDITPFKQLLCQQVVLCSDDRAPPTKNRITIYWFVWLHILIIAISNPIQYIYVCVYVCVNPKLCQINTFVSVDFVAWNLQVFSPPPPPLSNMSPTVWTHCSHRLFVFEYRFSDMELWCGTSL